MMWLSVIIKVYDWIPLTLKRLQRESTTIMEWLSEHYAIVMLMLRSGLQCAEKVVYITENYVLSRSLITE